MRSVTIPCAYHSHSTAESRIILFEVPDDASVLASLYREEWFKAYLAVMGPLLAEPPQIFTGVPVWTKGI